MKIFPTTEGVEVFLNEEGSITISQESSMGEDASLVAIPLCHINALCRALKGLAKEARDSEDA